MAEALNNTDLSHMMRATLWALRWLEEGIRAAEVQRRLEQHYITREHSREHAAKMALWTMQNILAKREGLQ